MRKKKWFFECVIIYKKKIWNCSFMTKDLMLRKGKNGHSKTRSKQTYKSMKTVFPQWVKCVENQKHADVFLLVLWTSKNNCIKIWWGYNRTTLYRRGFQTNQRNASKSSFVRLKIIWKWQKVGNLWVPSAFVYMLPAVVSFTPPIFIPFISHSSVVFFTAERRYCIYIKDHKCTKSAIELRSSWLGTSTYVAYLFSAIRRIYSTVFGLNHCAGINFLCSFLVGKGNKKTKKKEETKPKQTASSNNSKTGNQEKTRCTTN